MTTESKSSSLRPVIGLDIGRSTVKAVTRSRNGNGSHKLVFPAIVANAFEISTEAEQKRTAIETVSINNKNYFFGDTAAIQTTSDIDSGLRDDWILTDEHKALFLGAIQRLKHEGLERSEEALVVVGLPGKLFSNQKTQLRESLKSVFPKGVVLVMPQPLGPFQTMVFNSNGTESEELDKSGDSWGVIEIGHYTTDFCRIVSGRVVESGFGSCQGMSIAAKNLQKILGTKDINITLNAASKAFIEKRIKNFGEWIDVNDEIEEAVQPLRDEILVKAQSIFGDGVREMDGVLIAGGGAPLIFDAIKTKWRHARLCDDSRFAVAEGFARYGAAYQMYKTSTAKA